MAVLQRLGRQNETRARVDVVARMSSQSRVFAVPFWTNLLECATLHQGGLIVVQNVPKLDFAMSCEEWKHQVRELMRSHAFLEACCMDRGLNREDAFTLDTFLLHHVLVSSRGDTAQETFASGAVVSGDRMMRHKTLCSGECEYHECNQQDTVTHRLYSCQGTAEARYRLGWTPADTANVEGRGRACAEFGIWTLPAGLCARGLSDLLSAAMVRECLSSLNGTSGDACVRIECFARTFSCLHPKGAFTWVYSCVQGVQKRHFCHGVSSH
eukprot:74087-Amphidinium_carterae.1